VLLLGVSGCRPNACDDADLLRAASLLKDRSSVTLDAGLGALADACPALPPSLQADLTARAHHAADESAAAVPLLPVADVAHAALFQRVCPRMEDERDAVLQADDFDLALRTTCDVDRYGVIVDDEPFVRDDIVPLMVYEWLTSTGAERETSREVARSLMYVGADGEERRHLCEQRDVGCEHLVAGMGIALPRSTSNTRPQDAVELLISRTHVTVEGVRVLALADGFERHVSGTLLAALGSRALSGHHALVLADRHTPFEVLANAAFTATKAGYADIDLAVLTDRSLRRIPLAVPLRWLRQSDRHHDRPLPLQLHVNRDAVTVTVGGTDIEKRFECTRSSADCDALAKHMAEFKEEFPHETVATFVIAGDAPLQTVVSVIDIARGLDCELPNGHREVPPDCLFWQPIIETTPRLFWNMDRIVGIELGEPRVDLREGGVEQEPILAALTSGREAIATCLLGHLPLLSDLREDLFVVVARSPGGVVAQVPDRGFRGTPLERCVLDPLGLAPPAPGRGSVAFDHVGLQLTIPVTLELR
jgi:hypothetical protein